MTSYGPYFFKPSSPRTRDQFQGSSFKPLSLAYHPWVRACHRDTLDSDASAPRLPFLMQYYHLHGHYPSSLQNSDDDNNRQTAEVEGQEAASDSHDSHTEMFEDDSTTSDVSNESDVSTILPHSEIYRMGSVNTPPLPYVLRPSCSRSSSSSMTTFVSHPHGKRECPPTSPDTSLSAFHDMFSMSICPSDDILFAASQGSSRGYRRRKEQAKVLTFKWMSDYSPDIYSLSRTLPDEIGAPLPYWEPHTRPMFIIPVNIGYSMPLCIPEQLNQPGRTYVQ